MDVHATPLPPVPIAPALPDTPPRPNAPPAPVLRPPVPPVFGAAQQPPTAPAAPVPPPSPVQLSIVGMMGRMVPTVGVQGACLPSIEQPISGSVASSRSVKNTRVSTGELSNPAMSPFVALPAETTATCLPS